VDEEKNFIFINPLLHSPTSPMSPNKRIFLNIIATYGRSLYALVLGLFTARWVLQALGQIKVLMEEI
jgi:hypothetical protein